MHMPTDLPDLVFVRVLSEGGPYRTQQLLSLAFATPTIARVAPHEGHPIPSDFDGVPYVPESVSAMVTLAAGPYRPGDCITLSFVDPRVARVHAVPANDAARTAVVAQVPVAPPAPEPRAASPAAPSNLVELAAVRVRQTWNAERARRFAHVCAKLFTVERLGWYRHAFAMRLLVPDEIATGDPEGDAVAMRHLLALRAAIADTLGRPLLAAFMPNFCVTTAWLAELDEATTLRALAALRDAVMQRAGRPWSRATLEADATIGSIARHELTAAPDGCVEAMLPAFIAATSPDAAVTEALTEYRRALSEVFAQVAQAAEVVRVRQMAQPNPALDDRLQRLAATLDARFAGQSA